MKAILKKIRNFAEIDEKISGIKTYTITTILLKDNELFSLHIISKILIDIVNNLIVCTKSEELEQFKHLLEI